MNRRSFLRQCVPGLALLLVAVLVLRFRGEFLYSLKMGELLLVGVWLAMVLLSRSLGDVVGRTVERGDGSDFRSRVDTVCPRHFRDSCVADDHWIDCLSLDKKLV